jgi:hypothetical protein
MRAYNIFSAVVTQYQVEANDAEEAKKIFYSIEDLSKILVFSTRSNEIKIVPALPTNRIGRCSTFKG